MPGGRLPLQSLQARDRPWGAAATRGRGRPGRRPSADHKMLNRWISWLASVMQISPMTVFIETLTPEGGRS
jgi:hypothetical protein